MTQIQTEHFTKAVAFLLDETFEQVHGIFLDKGTSLFETLATISADEASQPVGGGCATLAAQVKHMAFYLDVVERAIRTGQEERHDWGAIWRETGAVTPEEWESSVAELRASYGRLRVLLLAKTEWPDEYAIGEAFAVVAHTAYHLGEIRQALCSLRP